MILLLEDDADRLRRFARALRREAPGLPVLVWRDAHRMAREVGPYLPSARLISLDHDLEPESADASDPGDGVDVARALVRFPKPCPTLIHSSNGTRSDWMAGEFELAGWSYVRVAPIGERWIEEFWRRVVRDALAGRVG